MILVIDNYDSFVDNLARQLRLLGATTRLVRNDSQEAADLIALRPAAIVLSPGPCTPDEAGVCLELVRLACGRIPVLGVCLGHQAICQALGGRIAPSGRPCHGQSSRILHDATGLFAGLPNPFRAGRYHSLVAREEELPPDLRVTARTSEGTVMAVAHRQHPVFGVQFHPESILTECGEMLLGNFLAAAGLPVRGSGHAELAAAASSGREWSEAVEPS